ERSGRTPNHHNGVKSVTTGHGSRCMLRKKVAMEPIRVLLADDHETVREGLRAILSADPSIDVVGEANDGESAVSRTEALRLGVSVKTIEAHKANAGQKLGLITRADVVRFAHVRGWLSDV